MYFRDVIGQDALKEKLLRTVREGKVSHALLFAGKEGTGGFPLAMAYARYLHCTDRQEKDACGHCPSCRKFDKWIHPDTHFVFPIYKPNSGKKWVSDDFLPQWREFLSEHVYFSYNQWMECIKAGNAQGSIYGDEGDEILRKLSFKTYESEYKVMLIWLPEKMQIVGANRLLKILEEPPAKTVFLLISEDSEQLLTTVRSRAQTLSVNGIEAPVLTETLRSRFPLEEKELEACVHLANGSYLKAVEYMESTAENNDHLSRFVRSMRGAYTIANFPADKRLEKQRALKDMKLWAEDMAKLGREAEKKYLAFAQRLVRENFILNLGRPEMNYLTPGEQAFSSKFAPFINHLNVVAFMEELELAERQIEQNANAKLVFFDLALQSILLFKK